MILFTKLYAVALVSLVVLDALWIGVIASRFYHQQLDYIFASSFRVTPAALFYLIYAAGLVIVVVQPSLDKPLWHALLYGALIGLMAYGAYDLTNQATIRDWPLVVTVVDLLWGIFATATAATLAVAASRFF